MAPGTFIKLQWTFSHPVEHKLGMIGLLEIKKETKWWSESESIYLSGGGVGHEFDENALCEILKELILIY